MPNNSGFSIGPKKKASHRVTPSTRGISGAPGVARTGSGRSTTPGLRQGGASGGGSSLTSPGLKNKPKGKGKGKGALGPAQGQVIQEGKVNGIHVRVSAPNAPAPNNSGGSMIDTTVKERNLSGDLPPEMVAAQSTSMMAGQQTGGGTRRRRRARPEPDPTATVTQLEPEPTPEPPVEAAPVEEAVVVEGEVVEEKSVPGSYWSDKYDRFVAPGEAEYSDETARRMGAA